MSEPIELFEFDVCHEKLDLNKIDLTQFSTIWYDNTTKLKANQFVGVAQFGDTRICVYPKMYYKKDSDKDITNEMKLDEYKKRAMSNFLFMMQYAYKIHNIKDYQTSAGHQNFDFLEVLIFIYAKNLMDLLKVNLNRSYIVVEDDSNFLKGSWRLGEQLSRMPHIRHRFLVSYDEFTENNPLNRILKFVTFMLLRFSRNSRSQTLLQNILLVYAEVDDISKPGHTYLEQVKFSRINQEFKSIFEFAKMFLFKLAGDYSKTKNTNFSFMFDMNILFEQFIAEFIRQENLIPEGLVMKTQSECRYLDNEKHAFMLKPDISFWNPKEKCELIIDTKYKLLDENKNKSSDNDQDEKYKGVSGKDAQQMYAYAMKYNCERVILLYPKTSGKDVPVNIFNFEPGKTLEIRTLDICRDLKKDKKELEGELRGILGLNDKIKNE